MFTRFHENTHKLAFISKNGPHPLVAMDVVEEALNLHFKGKPWHFALAKSKYYVSKAVDSIFKLKICPIYWLKLLQYKL